MACNCYDYPFVPHIPCFEECTRRSLSLASYEELREVFDIPAPIAEKINKRNIETDVQSLEDFRLSPEEFQVVKQIFSNLHKNGKAIEWLKLEFPLFEPATVEA